ncbi:tyrosine-type recombinase/integrase [Dethiosulfatarculus sandiegensis]|uniref:tyrosine-type recombinase/integrase n=1 Tax=Dethiosulfatarculus sandiegensis TaxID=1429043 RepID=UPI0033902118
MRHVAATEVLAAGADSVAVQYQLGHKNLSTTINVYSHVLSDAQERAARMLPDLNGNDENWTG